MEKVVYSRYLDNFKCKYYITKSVKTFSDGNDKVCSYGVKIEKMLCNNKKESVEIRHVGINKIDVKIYLKKLYNSCTTPEKIKEKLIAG